MRRFFQNYNESDTNSNSEPQPKADFRPSMSLELNAKTRLCVLTLNTYVCEIDSIERATSFLYQHNHTEMDGEILLVHIHDMDAPLKIRPEVDVECIQSGSTDPGRFKLVVIGEAVRMGDNITSRAEFVVLMVEKRGKQGYFERIGLSSVSKDYISLGKMSSQWITLQ